MGSLGIFVTARCAGAKGNSNAISTSFSSFQAVSSTTIPRRTPISSQSRETRSASQPAKRTCSIEPVDVGTRVMGRSPKVERRRRSARMRNRSRRARATSEARLSRRLISLREVMLVVEDCVVLGWEKEGERAVMVGLSLNSRFVPRVDLACDCSHALYTLSSVTVMDLYFFCPVTGSTPSKLAFPPPTQKARIPALTFCTTCACAPDVCEKCLAPDPLSP